MNPQTHTVAAGETLSGIAAKYGVNYQDIAKANGIANPNLIYPGQTFKIPTAAVPTATPTPTAAPGATPNPAQPTTPSVTPSGSVPIGFQPTDEWAHANTRMSLAELYKAHPEYQQQTSNISNSATPKFDLVAATNAAYNTPEITAANKAIDDATGELTTRQQALATAQAGINDNPFYSEATRVGKSQQLTQQANADMGIIQNKITEANNKVAGLKADAAIKVNAASGQYNIDRQAYQDNLSNFNNLLSAGALDNASGQDLANLAVQTGIPMSEIQSMVTISKQKNDIKEKPQIVTATDDQGNLSVIAIDPITGKVVSQSTVGGAGKATKAAKGTGTSAADQKTSDLQQNTANAAAAAKAGAQLKELVDHYGSVLSTDQIYSIYNSNAKSPAKESLDSVKQGRYSNVANSGWQPATTK